LTSPDITTNDFEAYEITGIISENYLVGESFLFTFFRKQKPITWRGNWDNTTDFEINDVVLINSALYIAVVNNTNSEPPSGNWELFVPAGPQGEDGNGIVDVVDNLDGTFTFNFTDETSFTTSDLTGPQGETGPKGDTGDTGPQGIQGETGQDGEDATKDPIPFKTLTSPANEIDFAGDNLELYNWSAPTDEISFTLTNLRAGVQRIIRVQNATAVGSEILINGDGSASFIGSTDNWDTNTIMEISIFGLSTTEYEWWYNTKER